MKIKYICPYCGGDNLLMDAFCNWDVSKQEWILHSTFDDVYCQDCESNIKTMNEVEIGSESEESSGDTVPTPH